MVETKSRCRKERKYLSINMIPMISRTVYKHSVVSVWILCVQAIQSIIKKHVSIQISKFVQIYRAYILQFMITFAKYIFQLTRHCEFLSWRF